MRVTDPRARKRGVRASRARLNHALAEAGFKTQTAVAERIADLEDLNAAPKDLVNRVFREQPVEPRSLERVARALGVEASSLYLSSTEAQVRSVTDTPSQAAISAESAITPRPRFFTLRRTGLVLAMMLLLIATAAWNLPASTSLGCRIHEYLQPLQTAHGRLGILIAHFQNDPDNTAQFFLASSFISDPQLRPYVSVLMTCHTLALENSGDIGSEFDALRARGRELLQKSGAAILIWGNAYSNRFLVRFISAHGDTTPVTMDRGDPTLPVKASRLQMFLTLAAPKQTLPDIKRITLALMNLDTPEQIQLRAHAMKNLRLAAQ